MSVLEGDPGSCSQAGGSLRRLASQLREAAAHTDVAARDLGQHWVGRASVAARRRQDQLSRAVTDTATALDRSGAAIQEHATDLAEAVQSGRALQEQAVQAGLQVLDGRIVPAWGVSGVADAEHTASRAGVQVRLQSELDLVALQLSRRRARLTAALEAARHTLKDTSGVLRTADPQ